MKVISVFSIMIVLCSFSTTHTDQATETYCNPRFGYCFTYDASIFNKIPGGINADGITITNTNGSVFLESYGSFNPYRLDATQLFSQNVAYLMRNEPSDRYTVIKQQKTDTSYLVVLKTADAYIQQELVVEGLYFKMLTVKVSRNKKDLANRIMASTRFVPSQTMAYH